MAWRECEACGGPGRYQASHGVFCGECVETGERFDACVGASGGQAPEALTLAGSVLASCVDCGGANVIVQGDGSLYDAPARGEACMCEAAPALRRSARVGFEFEPVAVWAPGFPPDKGGELQPALVAVRRA